MRELPLHVLDTVLLFSWIRAAEAGRGRPSTGVVTLVLCSTPEASEGTKDGDPILASLVR
jgi:hypothetical protein